MWWLWAAFPLCHSAPPRPRYPNLAIDSICHLGIDCSGRHYVSEIKALRTTVSLKWKNAGWEPMRWAQLTALSDARAAFQLMRVQHGTVQLSVAWHHPVQSSAKHGKDSPGHLSYVRNCKSQHLRLFFFFKSNLSITVAEIVFSWSFKLTTAVASGGEGLVRGLRWVGLGWLWRVFLAWLQASTQTHCVATTILNVITFLPWLWSLKEQWNGIGVTQSCDSLGGGYLFGL